MAYFWGLMMIVVLLHFSWKLGKVTKIKQIKFTKKIFTFCYHVKSLGVKKTSRGGWVVRTVAWHCSKTAILLWPRFESCLGQFTNYSAVNKKWNKIWLKCLLLIFDPSYGHRNRVCTKQYAVYSVHHPQLERHFCLHRDLNSGPSTPMARELML